MSKTFQFQAEGKGEILQVFVENDNGQVSQLLWTLEDNWSSNGNWAEGRIEINGKDLSEGNTFFKIKMVASKGTNDKSFVIIDEFVFLQTESCEFQPPEADPNLSTTPKTTPQPTEPPSREYFH